MIKFELRGYRSPYTGLVSDTPTEDHAYPVYDAVYISEDLIFGRDD